MSFMIKKPFVSNEEFGKIIPELKINGKEAPYPVVNDRAVRATAGIMMMLGIFACFHSFYTRDFVFLKIVIILFFFDFLLKTLKGPMKSFFGFFGRKVVSKQKPEFVGAIQKRFAWSLGLGLSLLLLVMLVFINIETNITLGIFSVFLALMWLESSMGICIGCYMFNWLIKMGIIKRPKFHPACPGGICDTDEELIEMY